MCERWGGGGILAAILLVGAGCAHVTGPAATAQVAGATGQVEVLRPGQAEWAPVVPGTVLRERDEMRAFADASAEVRLPDGSALFVAENSRVVLATLDVTPRGDARAIVLYVPAGKVRAVVAAGTLEAVLAGRARFVVATPTTQAGASGTNMVVSFDPAAQSTLVACLSRPASPGASPEQCARDEAECGRLADASARFDVGVFVRCMNERGYDVRLER